MNHNSSLEFTLVPDLGQPEEIFFQRSTALERRQANALPTERRRRQYFIGRLAARKAIRQLLHISTAEVDIEILSELDRGPHVYVNGSGEQISISISHSSQLAVACAWFDHSKNLDSAGIDLEHVRQNKVVESYAFSDDERRILSQAPEGPEIASLAGWTVKESVWKALLAGQEIGPDAIEIQQQSIAFGHAMVTVKGQLSKRLGDSKLNVRMGRLNGPDGAYVFSIAQVIPESCNRVTDRMFDWQPKQTNHSSLSMEKCL